MSMEGYGAAEVDKHHSEGDWEAQRQIFTHYYSAENKTLKEAARCMRDNHNFFATPRQWERKIKAWGLGKYVSRQQRLDQLASEGRDLNEVAQPGRRPRKYSDSKLLHIKDDRNVRRFAKRELSRSPSRHSSRSRSVSLSPSPSPRLGSFGDDVVRDEKMYNSAVTTQNEHHDHLAIPAFHAYHSSDELQDQVAETQDLGIGSQHTDVFLSLPIDSHEQPMAAQYDQFPHMSEELPLHASTENGIDPLSAHCEALSADFYAQHHTEGMDLSPSQTRTSNHTTWSDPQNFAQHNPQASFRPDLGPRSESLPQDRVYDYEQSNDATLPTIVLPNHELDCPDGSVQLQAHQLPFDYSFIPAEVKDDTASYGDLTACLEQYTQNVHTLISSSAAPPDVRNDLTQQLELQKRIFVHNMNTFMNNYMASQQRAIQSIQQKNQALQNHINAMFQEKSQSVVVHEPASAHATLGHRFSLSGPIGGEYHHLYQTPSRPMTPIGVSM